MAKEYLERILSAFADEIDRGTPFVVLEPSCCSVFRDELTGLFPDLPQARKLKEQTFTLAEFLEKQKRFKAPTLKKKALVHGHCHQKAIVRMKDEESLFKKIGLEYELLDSGCCGMAGSFGFEEDKYDVSVKIGERALLPAVRKAERSTLLVADGFSCKEQIQQLTDRHALHTAELLALAMRNPDVTRQDYPELQIIRGREEAQKKSMREAAGVLAALAVAAGVYLTSARKK